MAQQIVMRNEDRETGSITVSAMPGGRIDLVFRRIGFPSVGIRLTEQQALMFANALRDECPSQDAVTDK